MIRANAVAGSAGVDQCGDPFVGVSQNVPQHRDGIRGEQRRGRVWAARASRTGGRRPGGLATVPAADAPDRPPTDAPVPAHRAAASERPSPARPARRPVADARPSGLDPGRRSSRANARPARRGASSAAARSQIARLRRPFHRARRRAARSIRRRRGRRSRSTSRRLPAAAPPDRRRAAPLTHDHCRSASARGPQSCCPTIASPISCSSPSSMASSTVCPPTRPRARSAATVASAACNPAFWSQ